MFYDRHPELQSKWNKAFWARGYYVETVGNITDEAVLVVADLEEKVRKTKNRIESFRFRCLCYWGRVIISARI